MGSTHELRSRADLPVAETAAPVMPALVALPAWNPDERVWFVKPHGLDSVGVMHARNSARPWKVWHEHYTLALIQAVQNFADVGGSEWRYRGRELLIVPGTVMLMEPGECHVTRRVSEAGDFDVFQLAPRLVEDAAQRAGLRTPIHLSTASTRDPVLCAAVAALAKSIDQPEALLQQELLERVLNRLLEHHAEQKGLRTPKSPKQQIARARDYILAHYADDFDLDRLSSVSGMSKSALSHCMPQELGVSPIGLRTLVRVSHAQRLLAQGMAVSDVAFSVGFCDQAALTRHMRSLIGVTPARYAKMMRP